MSEEKRISLSNRYKQEALEAVIGETQENSPDTVLASMAARGVTVENGHELVITIPPVRNRGMYFTAGFLCFWLCGWFAGELFALFGLYKGPWPVRIFLLVWISFWTFGGITAIRFLIRIIGGTEIIRADSMTLWITTRVLGHEITRTIPRDDIAELSVNDSTNRNPARILIRTSRKTLWIGYGLSNQEAEVVVDMIRERLRI